MSSKPFVVFSGRASAAQNSHCDGSPMLCRRIHCRSSILASGSGMTSLSMFPNSSASVQYHFGKTRVQLPSAALRFLPDMMTTGRILGQRYVNSEKRHFVGLICCPIRRKHSCSQPAQRRYKFRSTVLSPSSSSPDKQYD